MVQRFQFLIVWLAHFVPVTISSEGDEQITQRLVIPVQEHEEVVLRVDVKSSFPFTDEHYIYARAYVGKNVDNLNMLTNPKISLNTSEVVKESFGGYSMTYNHGIYEHAITVVINTVSKKRDEGSWRIHTIIFKKDSKTFLTQNTYRFALVVQRKDSGEKCQRKGRKKCKGSEKPKSRKQILRRLLRRMKARNS